MKYRTIILIAAVLLAAVGLCAGIRHALASGPGEINVPQVLPRNQTLYISGIQAGSPTIFNPLNSNAAWPVSGNHLLTYETLFAYNQLTGALDPLLAKDYEFSTNTITLTVTLQDNTQWQDGQPLTTDDVVYSYELAQSQPVNYSNLFDYITEIKSTGDRTLLITLSDSNHNPGIVKNFLATIKILPMHIWQPREAQCILPDCVETSPVGSGPYTMINYSPEEITLFRDDQYWGKTIYGLPRPKYVVHSIFLSNEASKLAFQNGDVDLSMSYFPELWEEESLPIGTWYDQPPYNLPGSIPILMINVHKPGLDNPLVRRALAYSIDYSAIAQAIWNDTTPVSSSLILPVGAESALFNPAQIAQYGWTYNPSEAEDILVNQLGATKVNGIYVLPGNIRLGPWSVRTPNGWSDWQAAVNIVVQNGNAAGFDLEADFPEFGEIFPELQRGDFDMNLWWITGSEADSPWARFRDMLDIRGVPPIGVPAAWNYGRFSNPAVPDLLDQAGEATNPVTVKSVYDQLDKIFMDNAPGIPLMYRPYEFYEFSTAHWLGFPTFDDPYAPPMFTGAGVEILYNISPGLFYLPVVNR